MKNGKDTHREPKLENSSSWQNAVRLVLNRRCPIRKRKNRTKKDITKLIFRSHLYFKKDITKFSVLTSINSKYPNRAAMIHSVLVVRIGCADVSKIATKDILRELCTSSSLRKKKLWRALMSWLVLVQLAQSCMFASMKLTIFILVERKLSIS